MDGQSGHGIYNLRADCATEKPKGRDVFQLGTVQNLCGIFSHGWRVLFSLFQKIVESHGQDASATISIAPRR
jgi:hypothetical protein